MDIFALPLAASPWPVQLVIITVLALVGAFMIWFLIKLQVKSVGHKFREDYWPIIRQSPYAVVAYRAVIIWGVIYMVTSLLGRFA